MSTPRLKTLTLRHFKGIKKFDLHTGGGDVVIRGNNATGKTSLVDAWNWGLFGIAPFEVKTLDANGEPLRGIDHTVEIVLDVDGRDTTFSRSYHEKWVKKRGSANQEFNGHATDYQVDGVPVTETEYKERVGRILDAATFRLLTDATHFNALPWKKRREVLLDVCGDVSDADVIASDPDLADLPGILDGRSMDDYRKIVDARRRKINEELNQLPSRVDELSQTLADGPTAARSDVERDLAAAQERLTGLQERLARASAGGEVGELQVRLREIDGKLSDAARSVTATAEDALAKTRRTLTDREEAVRVQKLTRAGIARELDERESNAARLEARMETLRAQWVEIDERPAPHTHVADACPACGQSLPAEQVTAAQQRALEEHNARKARELEENSAQGKRAKEQRDVELAAAEELRASLAEADATLETAKAAAIEAYAQVDELATAIPDPKADPAYLALEAEKARIQTQLDDARAGTAQAEEALRTEIAAVNSEIQQLQRDLSTFDARARTEARIESLKADEKRLNTEYEDLGRHLHLMETFIRTKVDALTDRINDRFELARFKLFDVQVNGAVAEACETTYDGVPFSSLNHGARVNVSLDIIRTLQRHYGAFPPVWVDGRESVTRLVDMPCQVLSLVVDANHAALSIEPHDAPQEVAA